MLFTSGNGLIYLPERGGIPVEPRIAAACGAPPDKIRELEYSVWGGILGENVINVMTQNTALDTLLLFRGM